MVVVVGWRGGERVPCYLKMGLCRGGGTGLPGVGADVAGPEGYVLLSFTWAWVSPQSAKTYRMAGGTSIAAWLAPPK